MVGGGGCEWHLWAVEKLEEDEDEGTFEMPKKQQKKAGQKKRKEQERAEARNEECEKKDQTLKGEVFVGMLGEDNSAAKERQMVPDFQVCEVKKALAAVHKTCRAGNVVQFGEKDEECFIKNKKSGKKVIMRKRGGSYVMDVGFIEKVEGGWVEGSGGDYSGFGGGGVGVSAGLGGMAWYGKGRKKDESGGSWMGARLNITVVGE